jgi:hypothetical protein
LLYLITRALERERDIPVLGLARDHRKVKTGPGLKILISKGAKSGPTRSTTHGGFDNDAHTLNDIMKRILSPGKPPHPFTKEELSGF